MGKLGSLVVGIDVGGTNTDAALVFTPHEQASAAVVAQLEVWAAALDSAGRAEEADELRAQSVRWQAPGGAARRRGLILGWVKRSTTADVTAGVQAAIRAVLQDVWQPDEVDACLVGTTHFVNAIVQRSAELSPVAVLRLCGPASGALPPFVSLPADLAAIVRGHYLLAQGGLEIDGQQEITAIDEAEIVDFVDTCLAKDLHCIVVCGVFSPVSSAQEEHAVELIEAELLRRVGATAAAGFAVTASHEVAGMGLLERESASILNATVQPLAQRTVASLRHALTELDLSCPLYLTQNDGTVAPTAVAERLPIRTFSSGPTNSMRGAAFISGLDDAVVVDVGGTTTDVGLLVGGFPRQAGLRAEIGGVETNYTIPDTVSVGLGGGSIVRTTGVGPDSVGHRLITEALCFGGSTVTATDVAIVHNVMDSADSSMRALAAGEGGDAARAVVTPADASTAWDEMQRSFEDLIDLARLSADDVPVIVVGGGAILVGEGLRGVSQLERPRQGGVANAVGAAIAQTSGTIDKVYDLSGGGRDAAFAAAEAEAVSLAVAAGALASSISVVEREEVPLAYMPGESARLRVRVVGDLNLSAVATMTTLSSAENDRVLLPMPTATRDRAEFVSTTISTGTENVVVDSDGYWVLRPDDVDAMAIGAGILGTCSGEY